MGTRTATSTSSGASNEGAVLRARVSQHRQAWSIASLPPEKLSKINWEKRTSACAVSSPANGVTKQPPPCIGTLIGQDCSARRKDARRGDASTSNGSLERGYGSDRKPASFNPFRGHRRVGSGSTISGIKSVAWDSTPWADCKVPVTKVCAAAAASPEKLDKDAASSLGHSVARTRRPVRSLSERMSSSLSSPSSRFPSSRSPSSTSRSSSSSSSSPSSPSSGRLGRKKGALTVGQLMNNPDSSKEDSSIRHPATTPSIQPDVAIASSPVAPTLSTTLNAPILETAAEILHEEFSPAHVPAQPIPLPDQPWGVPTQLCRTEDTNMEDPLPASPTASIAALFEDAVVGGKTDGGEEEEEELEGGGPGGSGSGSGGDVESEPFNHGNRGEGEEEGSRDVGTCLSVMCCAARNEGGGRGEEMVVETAMGDREVHVQATATELPTSDGEPQDASIQCCISSGFDDGAPAASGFPSPSPSPPPRPPPPFPIDDHGGGEHLNPRWRPCDAFHREPPNVVVAPAVPPFSPTVSTSVAAAAAVVKAKVPVVKPTLRKRRRSASGSSLSALLQVVRVPEEGVSIVSGRGGEDAAAADGRGKDGRIADASWPEDAVKSTYSKFVDIEIDPARGCVELIQHSNDISKGEEVGGGSGGWKRHPQAAFFERQFPKNSSRRLPPVKINTCSLYDEKTRARKTKTIRRGGSGGGGGGRIISSYDLDTLKDYLKTPDPFTARAVTEPTTDPPPQAAPVSASATPPPRLPPPQTKIMDTHNQGAQDRSCAFVSRLQAPRSGTFLCVDGYRPCSVSILSNPSFSSSHQDKLWEEQSDIYSSGGRGTPGRDDDDDDDDHHHHDRRGDEARTPPSQTLLYNLRHSPLPAFGSIHHHHHHHHHHPQQHPHHNPHQSFNTPLLRRSGPPDGGSMRSLSEPSGHFMQHIMSAHPRELSQAGVHIRVCGLGTAAVLSHIPAGDVQETQSVEQLHLLLHQVLMEH